MGKAVRVLLKGMAVVFGMAALVLFWASRPVRIEGAWKGYVNACLCDSTNFWWFEDGRIDAFSDSHVSEIGIGEYQRREDGSYLVVVYEGTDEEGDRSSSRVEWDVVPKRGWLEHPVLDDLFGVREEPLIKLYRYVFPVGFRIDVEGIMASAEERNRAILVGRERDF